MRRERERERKHTNCYDTDRTDHAEVSQKTAKGWGVLLNSGGATVAHPVTRGNNDSRKKTTAENKSGNENRLERKKMGETQTRAQRRG